MDPKQNLTPMEEAKSQLYLGVVGSLTLGLAPFFPAPHIIGKVRWVLGGGHGMKPLDWFDFVLHGAPWVYLVYAIFGYLKVKNIKH